MSPPHHASTEIEHSFSLRGNSSLSDDGRHLAVANMVTGFDIYNLKSEDHAQITQTPLRHDMGQMSPTPVRFVHGGHALLAGSATGRPHLWSLDGEDASHQTLDIGGKQYQVVCVTVLDILSP